MCRPRGRRSCVVAEHQAKKRVELRLERLGLAGRRSCDLGDGSDRAAPSSTIARMWSGYLSAYIEPMSVPYENPR